MRVRVAVLTLAGAAALALPASAQADFPHVVAPGESLTSIAAVDGLSVAALAEANGLPLDAELIAGNTILIPPQGAAAAGTTAATGDGDNGGDDVGASTSAGGSYVVQPGDTLTAIAARAGTTVDALAAANGLDPSGILPAGMVLRVSGVTATSTSSAPYVVQPGDTLTAIAARAGTTVDALAAANGLNPSGILPAGIVLKVGGLAAAPAGSSSQPVGAAAEGSPSEPPYPTPETLDASTIGQIGADNGVPSSLTDAIAWQESGFNNDLVSSADARGIMQILPGTWQWIQQSLVAGAPPLAPASAYDNVRGGALLLHWLLQSTGGDSAMAAAGYFQGLPSVERYGMYQSTQQYVNDVMALQQQFGGG